MKKSLISLAIVAGMAASGAALAEMKVYGNVHVSIDNRDSDVNGMDMNNQTSHLGFKGSEDLGDGMKAFAKVEFGIDPVDGGGPGNRDQLVGIKGGMGTVKFGTMSTNYKQMGGKVDPFYRTTLEARGRLLGTQSRLHAGLGTTSGRQTNTLQLTSSKMGGIQAVVNTTFNDAGDETTGIGVRYAGKGFMVYADMITIPVGATTETATKFGGTYKMGALKIGAQLEMSEDTQGEDYTFVSANYSLNKNDSVAASFGTVSALAANSDRTGIALMYKHKMSKMTNIYAGYGDRSDDNTANDDNALVVGVQKKF